MPGCRNPSNKDILKTSSKIQFKNIELIAKHEQDFLSRRTWDQKVGDAISGLVGSRAFVASHVIALATWTVLNVGWIPKIDPFDPAPFPILDLFLAFESILLASFILMRQSCIARRTEERNHLELQLMILTEKEVPANLGVRREIAGSPKYVSCYSTLLEAVANGATLTETAPYQDDYCTN